MVGGQQRAGVARVALLAALVPLALGLWRAALDSGAVGGRELTGIGRVLAEPLLRVAHAPLEGVDSLLVLLEGKGWGGLRGRGYLVPQRSGDWRLKLQAFILHGSVRIQKFKS